VAGRAAARFSPSSPDREDTMSEDIQRWLASKPAATAELARQLCDLILKLYPHATVTVDSDLIGFGSRRGYKGLVFVVGAYRQHVTLGLSGGADLPDPAGLMEGTGKVHRHVKLRRAEELDRPELRELMAAALKRQAN
jgi:hypothetical protein